MNETPLILIVEDDTHIALGMQVRLQSAGFLCVNAEDGQKGLDAAIEKSPDIIIADIRMPNMDGLSMLRGLKGRTDTASIPVIINSANIAEEARAKAKELGAYCFLNKPYSSSDLIKAVHSALGSNSTQL